MKKAWFGIFLIACLLIVLIFSILGPSVDCSTEGYLKAQSYGYEAELDWCHVCGCSFGPTGQEGIRAPNQW